MDVQCIVMYGVDKWCSYRILSLWFVKFLAHVVTCLNVSCFKQMVQLGRCREAIIFRSFVTWLKQWQIMRSFKTPCWKCIVFVQKLLREHLCLTFLMFPGVYQEVCSLRNWLPDALDASIFTKSVKLSSKQHPEVLCLTWRLDVFLPIPRDSRLGTRWAQGPPGHKPTWNVRRCMIPCNFQPSRDQVVPGTGNWEGFLKSPLAISSIKSRGFRSQKDAFFANS